MKDIIDTREFVTITLVFVPTSDDRRADDKKERDNVMIPVDHKDCCGIFPVSPAHRATREQ